MNRYAKVARRLLPLCIIVITACTPLQVARWEAAKAILGPEVAEQVAASYGAVKAEATAGRPCAEWYDYAIEAGFTPEQWPTVSRIMWGESRCNPMADSSISTARGLMQHLSWWAPRCGGIYEDLYDPTFSMNCAYQTYLQQGWNAWEAY